MTPASPILSGRTYEILKWVAAIVLPAIGALYFALSGIWGLPKGEEVVGTIAAINVFVGAIVGVSTKQYYANGKYDGVANVLNADDPNQKTLFDLELNREPESLVDAKDVTFRINKK